MKNIKNLTLAIIVVTTLLALSCTRQKRQALEGDVAPDFTLNDLRGKAVHLADLKGNVVLLEFWATWCPPCKDSIPTMNDLYKRYHEKGLILLGISVDKGQNVIETVKAFVKEHSIQYPILIDNKDVNTLYGVYSIPTIILIDKKGKIVSKNIGFSPEIESRLSSEIERLLNV